MARRFSGRYSPDAATTPARKNTLAQVNPVGARANLMTLPPVALLFSALFAGPFGLIAGLAGAALLALGAWLLRGGLEAEAAFNARKAARRPAMPRKIAAAGLAGVGVATAGLCHGSGIIEAGLYGVAVLALHLAAFGLDPLADKGLSAGDGFQHDRVARVVDEAEQHLEAMTGALQKTGDREVRERMERFQAVARELIRTVQDDPRDLTAARRYLGVYLLGARDASIKFAEIRARGEDTKARADYLALLDDLQTHFEARRSRLLEDDHSDLSVEIDVLRARLDREGVKVD